MKMSEVSEIVVLPKENILRRCDRCEFSLLRDPLNIKSDLECRGSTPVAIVVPTPKGPAVAGRAWPAVNKNDWCGKFELKEKLKH